MEFALIAPLLLLLLFGVIEFGRVIATYTSVTTAAREGARYGTTVGESDTTPGTPRYLDCQGIRDAAKAKTTLIDLDDSDIDVFFDNGPGGGPVDAGCQGGLPAPTDTEVEPGDRIVVRVNFEFESPVPVISNILGTLDVESEQARTIFQRVEDD